MKIKKAVFPVAGWGTRFLPATKASPKEMLPVVDKPLIQYAVDEAVSAGLTELIFVTSSSKRAIEDHFDSNYELENRLRNHGKDEMLAIVENVIPKGVNCSYVRQPDTLGLGHAILSAKHIVGYEPFAVLLADDLIEGYGVPCLKQMVEAFEKEPSSIIAVQEVPHEETHKYGIVGLENFAEQFGVIQGIVEKPQPKDAPSNLAAVGRYILTPYIFDCLEQTVPGAGGEIQLTDAIASLLKEEVAHAYLFSGKRYDCGDKLGYMQAMLDYGLKHPEIGARFKRYLIEFVQTLDLQG